jgi:hypothetical protein
VHRVACLAVFICLVLASASLSAAQQLDRGWSSAILLADGAITGDISVLRLEQGHEFAHGRLVVHSEFGPVELDFRYLPVSELPLLSVPRAAVLFYTAPDGERILQQYPVLGIRPAAEVRADQELEKYRSAARARRHLDDVHCSAALEAIMRKLDGHRQQQGVDQLFARQWQAADLLCLVQAIASRQPLKAASFAPPFTSREGVYRHGFPTRGDLIAYLLPHLAQVNIRPHTFPLSDRDRAALVLAWASWFAVGEIWRVVPSRGGGRYEILVPEALGVDNCIATMHYEIAGTASTHRLLLSGAAGADAGACSRQEDVMQGVALDLGVDAGLAVQLLSRIERCRQDVSSCGPIAGPKRKALLAKRRVSRISQASDHLLLTLCDDYQFIETGECSALALWTGRDGQIHDLTVVYD